MCRTFFTGAIERLPVNAKPPGFHPAVPDILSPISATQR
jgi:hypothetical protein